MIARNQGRIINIGSIAGIRMTFFGSVDYTASRHGVAGITQHLAWELADHRITVNSVCPGITMTPLMEKATTAELREIDHHPLDSARSTVQHRGYRRGGQLPGQRPRGDASRARPWPSTAGCSPAIGRGDLRAVSRQRIAGSQGEVPPWRAR